MAAGRRNLVENGLELSKEIVARELMIVRDNLLVIRMDVAGLTQWGPSWPGERACGRGGIRKNCGNLWKNQRPQEVNRAAFQAEAFGNMDASRARLPVGNNV